MKGIKSTGKDVSPTEILLNRISNPKECSGVRYKTALKSNSTEEKAGRNTMVAHFLDHHGDVFYVVLSDTLPVRC